MALSYASCQGFVSLKLSSFVHSPKASMAKSIPTTSMGLTGDLKKPLGLAHKPRRKVEYSMPPEKLEIFKSLENWAEKNVLTHLKPVEKCWQPQHFLPDAASDGFFKQVEELRKRTAEIPDDYFVVLVGDMITEEALPTYQSMLNTRDKCQEKLPKLYGLDSFSV